MITALFVKLVILLSMVNVSSTIKTVTASQAVALVAVLAALIVSLTANLVAVQVVQVVQIMLIFLTVPIKVLLDVSNVRMDMLYLMDGVSSIIRTATVNPVVQVVAAQVTPIVSPAVSLAVVVLVDSNKLLTVSGLPLKDASNVKLGIHPSMDSASQYPTKTTNRIKIKTTKTRTTRTLTLTVRVVHLLQVSQIREAVNLQVYP